MALFGQCPRSEFVIRLQSHLWAPGRWTFLRVNWELGCQDRASWSSYCCSGIWTQVLVIEGSCGRIKALRSDGAVRVQGSFLDLVGLLVPPQPPAPHCRGDGSSWKGSFYLGSGPCYGAYCVCVCVCFLLPLEYLSHPHSLVVLQTKTCWLS